MHALKQGLKEFALSLLISGVPVRTVSAQPPAPLHLRGGVGHISVRGQVGGEEHDGYLVELEANRAVKITLVAKGGRAKFKLCDSDNFFETGPVPFGKTSPNGRSWTGTIPVRKLYYIYVVAYPDARYTLSLWVK